MTETAPHTAAAGAEAESGKGRALFRIQTFTARYDAVEDRVRLDAVDAQGGKQSILLTRHLVDRVIGRVAKAVEIPWRWAPSM